MNLERKELKGNIITTIILIFIILLNFFANYILGTMQGKKGYYLGYARVVFSIICGIVVIGGVILIIKKSLKDWKMRSSCSNMYEDNWGEPSIGQSIKSIALILAMGAMGMLFLLSGVVDSMNYYADLQYLDKPKTVILYEYSLDHKVSTRGPDNYWIVGVDGSGEEYKFNIGDSFVNREFTENDSCIVEYLPHSKIVMEAYTY